MLGDSKPAKLGEAVEHFRGFLVERYGSVLKAWRRALDPNGQGRLFFYEFVGALSNMSWQGDTSVLWSALLASHEGDREGECTVSLRELSEEHWRRLDEFRQWTIERFGGPVDMFEALNESRSSQVMTRWEFVEAVTFHGFQGDAGRVFNEALEDGEGLVSIRDLAAIEPNLYKRRLTLDADFTLAISAARRSAEQMRQRGCVQKKAQDKAYSEFMSKLKAASGGSFIRGWRKILDFDENLAVSKIELLKGCKKINYTGDAVALWRSMDVHDAGTVLLQDVDVRLALALAVFKKHSTELSGSCTAAMQQLAAKVNRRSAKWKLVDFCDALEATNFPSFCDISTRQAAAMLFEAFDLNDTAEISSQDVAFLDKFEFVPWLSSEPDYEGKRRFMHLLLSRYGSLTVAWRRFLDRDQTNKILYKDFGNICRTLRLQNVPGIWRALDKELIGCLTLHDVDQDSADALRLFKEWAEEYFGTVQCAFRMLDTSRSGALSFAQFRRALPNFGFDGDTRVLFLALLTLKPESSQGRSSGEARLTLEHMRQLAAMGKPLRGGLSAGLDARLHDNDAVSESWCAMSASTQVEHHSRCRTRSSSFDGAVVPAAAEAGGAEPHSDAALLHSGLPSHGIGTMPHLSTGRAGRQQKPSPSFTLPMSEFLSYCKTPMELEIRQRAGNVSRARFLKIPTAGEPGGISRSGSHADGRAMREAGTPGGARALASLKVAVKEDRKPSEHRASPRGSMPHVEAEFARPPRTDQGSRSWSHADRRAMREAAAAGTPGSSRALASLKVAMKERRQSEHSASHVEGAAASSAGRPAALPGSVSLPCLSQSSFARDKGRCFPPGPSAPKARLPPMPQSPVHLNP